MEAGAPLLDVRGLEVAYAGHPVLRNLDSALGAGEILCVIGASGSGKSTLLRALIGLLPPGGQVTRGSIRFQGQELTQISSRAWKGLRGRGIGLLFQDAGDSFCPVRTLGRQYEECLAVRGPGAGQRVRKQALALWERLGLEDGERIWDSYPFELSGGMNQRVAFALALLLEPALLLADEPTSALDVQAQSKVLQVLKEERDRQGMGVILVTHDMGVVAAVADTVLVLQEGRCVEYGPAQSVLQRPQHPWTCQLLEAAPRLRR